MVRAVVLATLMVAAVGLLVGWASAGGAAASFVALPALGRESNRRNGPRQTVRDGCVVVCKAKKVKMKKIGFPKGEEKAEAESRGNV
jgi:hypothetical protein